MNDSAIIKLYLCRNEEALTATADKYGEYLYKIAKNILRDREDEEECVNDTYLRLWSTIPPENPTSLKAYSSRIVRNLAFDKYRKAKAEKRGSGDVPLILDELAEIVSGRDIPETETDRKELAEAISEFLNTLKTEKKAYFICRYWHAMSIKEIAGKYQKTENHISVSLNRTRAKLKEYLTERGFSI